MIKIEVREGKLPLIIGIGTIFAGCITGLLSVVYAVSPEDSTEAFISTVLTVLVVMIIVSAGTALCLCAKNRGITVEDEHLCYKNCIGRKKEFTLEDIGYCRAAFENSGNRDYMILYSVSDVKLCKLEFNMKYADVLLQYLADNGIRIECSQKSDLYLKWIVNTHVIAEAEVPSMANEVYGKTKELMEKWIKRNKSFGAEWKYGLAFYAEDKFLYDKPLWQQEECKQEILTEGTFAVIEGYLQKDGKFVIDRKNQPVSVSAKFMQISKSLKIGGDAKIYYYGDALEYLSEQLSYYEKILPQRRYHTEELVLGHELKRGM